MSESAGSRQLYFTALPFLLCPFMMQNGGSNAAIASAKTKKKEGMSIPL